MESMIAKAMKLAYPPVALFWSERRPGDALQFGEGKWGCVMWLVASAAKGKPAVCDRKTFGCVGGGVGLGFGNQYVNFAGGQDCFCRFLANGNESWETGKRTAEHVKPFLRNEAFDNFMHGERYIKTPELVEAFIKTLPITEIEAPFVVFKPLNAVDRDRETPRSVIFFADADQLSALVVLANYARENNENVIIPYAAACQTIGIYPYREADSEPQRAVVGLTDLSARVHINRLLSHGLMTFTVPWQMFKEMEGNVPGSFLERHTWEDLARARQ